MSTEIPSALIRKIQAGLRERAGVPSYDSTDQSLPSFHDALSKAAAEDPSVPSYLRCNRCSRKLLGGIRSTLCIFCGQQQQQQRREGFSHSVSFTSTAAYRNLLQSLGLNGSDFNGTDEERVASSTVQGAPMSDEYSNDSDLETSNSKIEKLLSDMPNLSFMLDSNLSIPKKIDGSYLNSS